MKFKDLHTIIEQIALLMASFVWTTIVLLAVVLFWAYQDVQTRWDYIINAPPQALAQAAETPTPTPTLWAGPGATLTPTPTLPPTALPTRVIEMPDMLPETLNPGDPTPIPLTNPANPGQEMSGAPANVDYRPSPVPGGSPEQPPLADIIPGDAAGAATVGNGIPTRLIIDSVGIDSEIAPVGWQVVQQGEQEYSIWQVADFAVGWHRTTAPLGQPGNTVMAGHHNVNGEVFRDLVNVEMGDKVTLYSGDKKYDYIVELKTIVKEKGEPVDVRRRNAQWIGPTTDERVTFVTCWPYTNNTHRVIVVAKPL
jgi:sortase A